MKKNGSKRALAILSVFAALVVMCVVLLMTHIISFEFYGFGVDSDERLYIGWGNKIEVYDKGERIRTIKRGTHKGHFNFTIQEDDTILLAFGSDVMVMDLMGIEVLKSWTEVDCKTNSMLEQSKYEFCTSDGDLYTASYFLGRATIYKNGKAIHKTPIIDCIVMFIVILGVPSLIVFRLIYKFKCANSKK